MLSKWSTNSMKTPRPMTQEKDKGHPLDEDVKIRKTKANTAAVAMARMMELVKEGMKRKKEAQATRSERTVSFVQPPYQGRLPTEHMSDVLGLLENETIAGIFLAVKDQKQTGQLA